jgi:hypothetical protein
LAEYFSTYRTTVLKEVIVDTNVKVEIPYTIKRGLDELWQMEQDICELRRIQTAVGYGQFGDEKQIKHLRYIASQLALESIERVCRETCEDARKRYTSQTGSEE